MIEQVILAGSGGQGIMLLGKILAQAALKENKYVTWLPAYGAEVRGGAAYCMVVIADEEIASPYIEKADTLIVMNEPAAIRFKRRIKDNGLVLLNSSLIKRRIFKQKNIKILSFPFTEIASGLGNIKVANMVALGSLLAQKKFVKPKTIFRVINETASHKLLNKINLEAFKEGLKLR